MQEKLPYEYAHSVRHEPPTSTLVETRTTPGHRGRLIPQYGLRYDIHIELTPPPSCRTPLICPQPEKKQFARHYHRRQESPLHKRLLVGCTSPRKRFDQHLTALRDWCKKTSTWSVKTQRAPPRQCRDARVYGHTTAAMHSMSTPPPPSLPATSPSQILPLLPVN